MKCFGVGRFVNDPVIKQVNETYVCDFILAVKERRRNQNKTINNTGFYPFVVWDSAAQMIHKYARKGTMISFEAVPKKEYWENDGQKHQRIVFRISDFELIHTKIDKEDTDSESD